jgi:hypothetical protein
MKFYFFNRDSGPPVKSWTNLQTLPFLDPSINVRFLPLHTGCGRLLAQRGADGARRGVDDLSPGCRAVELSRLRRAAVEAAVEGLSRPCLSSSCRVAVE